MFEIESRRRKCLITEQNQNIYKHNLLQQFWKTSPTAVFDLFTVYHHISVN